MANSEIRAVPVAFSVARKTPLAVSCRGNEPEHGPSDHRVAVRRQAKRRNWSRDPDIKLMLKQVE